MGGVRDGALTAATAFANVGQKAIGGQQCRFDASVLLNSTYGNGGRTILLLVKETPMAHCTVTRSAYLAFVGAVGFALILPKGARGKQCGRPRRSPLGFDTFAHTTPSR